MIEKRHVKEFKSFLFLWLMAIACFAPGCSSPQEPQGEYIYRSSSDNIFTPSPPKAEPAPIWEWQNK